MKGVRLSLILIVYLFIRTTAWSQANFKEKIKQAESNLVGTIQIAGDAPKTLQQRMAEDKIKGLSLAVIENYQVVWAKGYGWADDSLKVPVTTQTLFQAASISKSLNSVGVLQLVQDKKLGLHSDINTYLASWKFPYDSLSKGKTISVANLLSHTGALTVHGFAGYEQGVPTPSIEQILDGKKPANSPAVRSMYEPGARSEYSGGGITISQLIVTDITHERYADYMKKRVLMPLGMTLSTFSQPPLDVNPSLLASGYSVEGKRLPGKYHIYPEQAAAGLWTNPTELAKYIIETQLAYEGKSSKVLDPQTTRLRLTPYHDNSAALGVFITGNDSTKYFGHGGANEGFRCQYYGSMEGGNGIVIMVNSDNGQILQELVNSIAKVYGFAGLAFTTTKSVVRVEDSVLESYTGQYSLTPTFIITLSREGNQLYAQATGQPKFSIYPEATNRFFTKSFPAEFEIVKNAAGEVTSAILYQNGQKVEAKKIK